LKLAGIIFSNIYDDTMGDLTRHRTVASLPFGGRYRQIDFALSNMVNSGISAVGVVTKYNYQSLMDHLGSCTEWDLNRKNGGLYIIPPFSTGHSTVYRGKIEAMACALQFLYRTPAKYVVLSDSTVICNIDYEDVLESHVASGVDVTVVCNRAAPTFAGERRDLAFRMNGNVVTDVLTGCEADKKLYGSMGMFVMEKEKLIHVVEDRVAHGFFHFEKDYIQREFINGTIEIGVYEFGRIILRNEDIASYFKNNLRLMKESVRSEIFNSNAPIYTKVRDEVPTYYGTQAKVDDCLIADGCTIEGEAENSVIFRDVTIEAGAKVRNCVIMQGSHIKRGAELNCVILDKEVTISEDTFLSGAMTAPAVINKRRVI